MMNMMRMKTKTRQSLSLFLLSSSLLFVVCLALAGFFFSVFFWASLPLHSQKSRFLCSSSLCWTNNEKKKKKRKESFFLPPTNSLSFSLFCCCSFFFLFDETERHETDLMRAHSERKISQKEREKSRRRTNAKTSKRENARFAKRKRRLSRSKRREQRFIPSTFFRVVAIRDTTPALLYSRARYRTTFCRPRRKGGRIFARCLT